MFQPQRGHSFNLPPIHPTQNLIFIPFPHLKDPYVNLRERKTKIINLRPNFVSSNNKGNFSTPRVDETGPAGVHGDIISIPSAKPDWWVVKRLPSILKNCNEGFKEKFQINICTILRNNSGFYNELYIHGGNGHSMSFLFMEEDPLEGANTGYIDTFRNAELPE